MTTPIAEPASLPTHVRIQQPLTGGINGVASANARIVRCDGDSVVCRVPTRMLTLPFPEFRAELVRFSIARIAEIGAFRVRA